jgi:DNA-directed RNA polymerase specialized sigma24 family protein
MPKNRPSRATRPSMSVATDSVRIERARNMAQATLASAGSLNLLDLYTFAQDAVHHMVVTICPTATQLRHHIIERVLDRLAGRLRREGGQGGHGGHGLQFATVPAMESYLKQSIRTNLIDARRAAKLRAEAAPLVDDHGVATPMVDVLPDPHAPAPGADLIDPAHHELLVRVLTRGVDALSPDARQALWLSLEGHTAPQIGALMARTPESVRQLLSRGIRSLRSIVAAELDAAGIPLTDIGLPHLQRLAELTAKRLAA